MTATLRQLVTHKLYLQALEVAREDDAMNGGVPFENFCDLIWQADPHFQIPLSMYDYRDCLRLAWIRFRNTAR